MKPIMYMPLSLANSTISPKSIIHIPSLYIYSEGKPQPLIIDYNTSKWLSSDSMMSVINNKLIQKLVQPSNKALDSLMLFGALGGILAGISSALILLKTFGVL